MEDYDIHEEIFAFAGEVKAVRARKKNTKAQCLVLCFPRNKHPDGDVYTSAESCVNQLRNDPSLLPLVETRKTDDKFYVVYEWPNSLTPLIEIDEDENREFWIMRAVAEILDSLYRRGLEGHFLGKEAIFVDEKNHTVRLGFVGLVGAFRIHQAGPWTKNKTYQPNWRDDIHCLAQCFKDKNSEIQSEIIRCCLEEDKCPRYPQLLRMMKNSDLFHPYYDNEIFLLFNKNIDPDKAEELVVHLNRNDCYLSPYQEDEKGKQSRSRTFQTKDFEGVFINSVGDEHFFVPHILRRNNATPKGVIERSRFEHVMESIRGTEGEYHHLATLVDTRSKAVHKWRLLPENEKEFIEEMKFKSAYIHVRRLPGSKTNQLAFLLRENETVMWNKVENLKEKNKQLDAIPMNVTGGRNSNEKVGEVDDITDGRLVVCLKSKKSDIPSKGKLSIGESEKMEIPFEFSWKGRHGILFFAAPKGFGKKSTKVPETLKSMQNNDAAVTVTIQGYPGIFGEFCESNITNEIITRDAESKFEDIPKIGELHEDVQLELIPFKRQIEAVDKFEMGDIAEPSLCGILATPSKHNPSIISPETLDPYQPNLDEKQKEAVEHALHQKPLFLIQGPPGTGKTTVIVEIIQQIFAANPRARILVCSQTNLAVDNVIERLPNKIEKRNVIRKIRLASKNTADKVTKKVRPFLYDERLRHWINDAINRSNQATKEPLSINQKQKKQFAQALAKALEQSESDDDKRDKKIRPIVKRWHAFLRNHQNKEDCQIRGHSEDGWLSLEMAFLKSMNVLGSTCVHIATRRYREIFDDTYDFLIMDEAGKATPAETMIPAVRVKQVVLIGDHKQLPPFITGDKNILEKAKKKQPELEDVGIEDLRRQFGESLFENLISAFSESQLESCQIMLNMQRRMPKQIGDLISTHFYEGKLNSPDDDGYAREKQINLPFKQKTSLLFVNTSKREKYHDNGRAIWRQNECNAKVVIETLQCLDRQLKTSEDVAVITAYRGQVKLLADKIRPIKFAHVKISGINTVDGFQGRENTIVIYDIVRSSSGSDSIGFLNEPRRINVALSRAQKLLIIIGDANFLIKRALPNKEQESKSENKIILGKIATEIHDQGFMFDSMEEALK